jgi:hypothetical protein
MTNDKWQRKIRDLDLSFLDGLAGNSILEQEVSR